jgi:hypothetical protein
MTTYRLVRVALVLAVMSTVFTAAAFALMFPNGFSVGGIFWPALVLVGTTYAWVGARVVRQEPRNAVGWFLLLGACVWAIDLFAEQYAWFAFQSGGSLPGASFFAWLSSWVWQLGTLMLLILMPIAFPDGHLPSSRWRPVVVAVVVVGLASAFAQAVVVWGVRDDVPLLITGNFVPTEDPSLAGAIAGLGMALIFLVGIPLAPVAVVLRWRASTGVRRLQIRWFVSAMALSAVCVVVSSVGNMSGEVDGPMPMTLTLVAMALPPIAIGIAILRYRLYEIDRLVSRSIAYAIVTGGLIVVYLIVNLVLTSVLSSVEGNDSVAVAASTLVVAALFTPLRRRVQRVVDRRFDRVRFDADRTTAAFAERLRNEIGIETVTQDLDATVRTAISPSAVGLWLRTGGAIR